MLPGGLGALRVARLVVVLADPAMPDIEPAPGHQADRRRLERPRRVALPDDVEDSLGYGQGPLVVVLRNPVRHYNDFDRLFGLLDPGHRKLGSFFVIGNERRLSAFARHVGAAIDNNRVERALRTSVRLREPTHFFRNPVGAGLADVILSVGATALHARMNLFEYFVDLQRHADKVRANPAAWVP